MTSSDRKTAFDIWPETPGYLKSVSIKLQFSLNDVDDHILLPLATVGRCSSVLAGTAMNEELNRPQQRHQLPHFTG